MSNQFDVTDNVAAGTYDTSNEFENACANGEVSAQNGEISNGAKVTKPKKRRSRVKQEWHQYGVFAVAEIDGQICVIDSSDIPLVENLHWFLKESGKNLYASSGQGLLMHRLVLGLVPGDGRTVDHRDHYGLNNWKDNLRTGTQSDNLVNSRKFRGASNYKGVWRYGDRWRASVGPRSDRRYLGIFDSEEVAARAVDAENIKIWKEKACLNFPLKAA